MSTKPLVIVFCITYNHVKFIRDCLNGFVMQNTNFPFVAVVHDDASTDGSVEIIREYEKKYPDIIKPIYEAENQYSKHDGSIKRIMKNSIDSSGAKYIALCEGDDYWTDPYKLQKQVDFLESHPDYSMCFHAAKIKNETETEVKMTGEHIQTREYFTKDIFPGWVIPTASVVYRRDMVDKYPTLKHAEWMKFGDIVLFLKCTHIGRIWGMSEKMSVYRMTGGGAVVSLNNEKEREYFEGMCKHYKFLMANFPQIDKEWICEYIATYFYSLLRHPHSTTDVMRGFYNVMRYKPSYIVAKHFKKG